MSMAHLNVSENSQDKAHGPSHEDEVLVRVVGASSVNLGTNTADVEVGDAREFLDRICRSSRANDIAGVVGKEQRASSVTQA